MLLLFAGLSVTDADVDFLRGTPLYDPFIEARQVTDRFAA